MEKSNSMNIYNLIILDESGSMSDIYDETLKAVNEAFSGIRRNQEEFPCLLIAPCGIEMH